MAQEQCEPAETAPALFPPHRRLRVFTALLVFAVGVTAVHWVSAL